MLTNRYTLASLLVGISWLASCKQDDDSVTCKPVETITPQSTCYDSSRGLTLVASGQTSSPDRSQFTWSIFPQSDTTQNSNIAAPLEKVLVGSETITVPDSILKNSPKFIVKVGRALKVDIKLEKEMVNQQPNHRVVH
ncbi:hypothetical protein [Spirosoma utsteinense]|uniref:Uncharacterized protein n=1 Tax=Spirosoma utsteinense TaxID=2585773 RepID=A0ABR6WG63_9BACT|nr:hypothetical protein [Spirosoma utsteinense]MBC3795334.1 hypothetical protein [Spirosoma utsteinense]